MQAPKQITRKRIPHHGAKRMDLGEIKKDGWNE
jgi:hypothetical protein